MSRLFKFALGLFVFALGVLTAPAQIGGTGWTAKTLNFKIQWPYNTNESSRYWFTNNIYHCLVYSNDAPFEAGNTTLPRTEQRFNPDYTNGEIQYQATIMAASNENSYCVFQIHTGDAQSDAYGSTTFMLFWFTSDGGSVHDYSGTELANNLDNKWFQVNVDHNIVTGTIRVWINKNLVWTQQDNGAGDFYFKDGVYEQSHTPTLQMDTYVTNILEWTSSGTNPPAAPATLTATSTVAQIGLVWSGSVGATNYNLKRATISGGPYTTIASLTGTNYTDAQVTNGTAYYYVVTAVDNFGESAKSTQVGASLINTGYQLSAQPGLAAMTSGSSTNFTVTLTTNTTFTGSVTFGLTGLPAGASASFNPPTLAATGNSTLTIQTTGGTLGGAYPLTIAGTNGGFIVTTSVTLALTGASTNPGTLFWTGGGGTNLNWSTAYNWTNVTAGGDGPPGINNALVFTNLAATNISALTATGSGVVNPAGINNYVNASFTIGGLTNFGNATGASPVYHNTGIASGSTLTTGGLLVGGFTLFGLGDNATVNETISGAGATLQITNGGVTVSEDATNSGLHNATLDLSGLDAFTMNGTQIRLGVEGSGNFHHASGVIYLAKTNSLALTSGGYNTANGSTSPDSGNPALYLGHNASSFGNGSQMYLGISNRLCLDYATIGRGDTNALLAFNPAFLNANPSVYIRGTNGGGTRAGVYVVGDGSSGAQANNAPATNDFTGGTVDAMINYLCVGRGRDANSSSVGGAGVLTFDQGVINANILAVGFVYPSGSNSPAMGTVNVNGTGTLIVNSNLLLSSQAAVPGGATMLGQGVLNLNGGTVETTNIQGGGVATINLNSGTLDLQSGNPAPGQIAGVSTLNIGANGIYDPALLTSAAGIITPNAIVIAPNGTLAGNTVITAPGLIVNGAISPGTIGAGWITNNGPVTLGTGGDYVVTVQDALAGPATDWSFWQVNGGINVPAASTNPFTISLQTAVAPAANFSDNTNYDWVIATAASGITNYSAAQFAVDDSLFANDLAGGYFYVRTNNHSLVLSFTNNHPPVATPVTLTRTGTVMAIPLTSLTAYWSDPDGDPVTLAGVSNSSTNGVNNVSTDGTYIYYTNAFNVADIISYTVQDVRTNPPAVYRPGDTIQSAPGTITILPARPVIDSVSFAGDSLVFSGSGGVASGTAYLLSSTNLLLPPGQWTCIATNTFDGSGDFNFTNAEDPSQPQQYFRLQAP